MEGFDPKTSFGYETSRRYDALETREDEQETVAFLARAIIGDGAEPFTAASWRHVSVCELTTPDQPG